MTNEMTYSVLMSVYYKENPDYLKISIESMLNQSVKPSQFVIVKDGQLSDALDKVIEEFCRQHQNLFHIVSLSKNMGLGSALNAGIEECTCELVT